VCDISEQTAHGPWGRPVIAGRSRQHTLASVSNRVRDCRVYVCVCVCLHARHSIIRGCDRSACVRGRVPAVEALLPARVGEVKDPHGLFELGFGSLPPFADEVGTLHQTVVLSAGLTGVCVCVRVFQPGVSELTFAGPLDMMPPRWRALATLNNKKQSPVDLAFGSMVKQLVADCALELANRMAKARRECLFAFGFDLACLLMCLVGVHFRPSTSC
jgi:hypothetical protein